MSELQLAVIDVKPGASLESQSGLQMLRPRIYGALAGRRRPGKLAAIVMHPTSNFMGHYLIGPLAARGIVLHGPELALHGQRHAAADGARDPGPRRRRAIPARGGLREGGADRQLRRRRAGELLPGAGRAAHGPPLRRRRPDPPAPGRPAAGGRHRAVRRAPGPLEADARLDRPLGDRRARPAVGRPELDMYDPRHALPYDAEFLPRFSAGQAGALDAHRGWAWSAFACCAASAGRAARGPGLHRLPHACRSALRGPVDRIPTTARPGSVWGRMARGKSTTRPMRWAAPPR